jgi:hypothetical protein
MCELIIKQKSRNAHNFVTAINHKSMDTKVETKIEKTTEQFRLENLTKIYASFLKEIFGEDARCTIQIDGVPLKTLAQMAECIYNDENEKAEVKPAAIMWQGINYHYMTNAIKGDGFSIDNISTLTR